MADNAQILGRMVNPCPTRIFMKHNIQDPVQLIFNRPMGAYRVGYFSAHLSGGLQ